MQGQHDGTDFVDVDGNVMDLQTEVCATLTCKGTPSTGTTISLRPAQLNLKQNYDAAESRCEYFSRILQNFYAQNTHVHNVDAPCPF